MAGVARRDALTVIEDRAARLGAPLLAYGQHWHVGEERGRLIYQDDTGLETEFIVVELCRQLLGNDWQETFLRKLNSNGIERVLL